MGARVTERLVEGDVFRWTYQDPNKDHRPYGDYHCCSCIAIVVDGRLRDTYWMVGRSYGDCRSFGMDDLSKLELKFLGNMSELEKSREYQSDYFDDADIVDLNHTNSTRGNFYLRKGAIRSQKKMLEVAQRKLEQSIADEQNAARRSDELRSAILRIQAHDLSVHL